MKAAYCVLVIALVFALGAQATNVKQQFAEFVTKYNKVYSQGDIKYRFQVFQDNMKKVETLNQRNPYARFGATKFADLTAEEFKMYKGYKPTNQRGQKLNVELKAPLPQSFDWRDKHAVTDVYDQGQCGSCWAFSCTEAIESQWFLAGHTLTSLSPQQIVDCDVGGQDEGCNGGDTPTCYQYVIKQGGLESWSDYPYNANDNSCSFTSADVVATISSWGYVTQDKNETEMQIGLVEKGPLSICVDAESWQFYFGGVVSDLCGNDLDHCVLIVGYEDYTTWDGVVKPIWMIRNSWGADWGEDGYIYVERGYDLCGVADEVTLPVV